MAHTSITKKTTDSRRKEQISFSSLLQNQFAHWMSDLPEKLWDESLCNLAIPGSHDSMTYCLDLNSPIKPSDKILNYLDHVIPCIIRPEIYRWCRTQEALKEFGLWLKAHPKEVVILACRSFDGMNEQQHHELIQEIKNLFESKIYPKTSSEPVTLRRLWELGCQVIISYDDNIAKQYPELWPGIPYWWADTYDPKLLVQYLENQKQAGRPDGFFVAGINLTEDWWYILTHLHSSLKRLTLPNYAYLSDWIKKQVTGPGKHCFNIIAGDFIGAGYLVPAVLSLNNIDVKIGRFY
ncbi:PI-PLC X domain-containing protein 1 isoform X2 [Chiloscyllium punctatum]|uniref:PI-PLC X domain-containing protein 1 isoform X2 n=1 Tax=Chiloscyllium punctatum TaxID=137246 RepID=UPI003B64030B